MSTVFIDNEVGRKYTIQLPIGQNRPKLPANIVMHGKPIVYLLFGFDYFAQGGINDLIEHFTASGDNDAIEKAKEFCRYTSFDRYQLVRIEETQTKEIEFSRG